MKSLFSQSRVIKLTFTKLRSQLFILVICFEVATNLDTYKLSFKFRSIDRLAILIIQINYQHIMRNCILDFTFPDLYFSKTFTLVL